MKLPPAIPSGPALVDEVSSVPPLAPETRSRPQSLRITAIRTRIVDFGHSNALLVWIDTDAGVTGVAETIMKRHTPTIAQGVHLLRTYLVGRDPTEIEEHWEKM